MKKTIQISVLMSIYNESESLIRESLDSLIAQTFQDFEIVIVCDNPKRKDEIQDIMQSYNDREIIVVYNESNLGLAMSMNKAAKEAHSDIFARMDADDIAKPERLEKEYNILKKKEYDFVFSKYDIINESSSIIKKEFTDSLPNYTPTEIPKILQFKNMIHHPTVMLTKEIFNKVGGYRDFPVSQDFDLWLRLNEAGCRFYMINESLLYYRVNTNGTTKRKWLQQQLTIHYIFQLSVQRLQRGFDNFSKKNYQKYLEQNGNGNEKVTLNLKRSENLLVTALQERHNGKKIKAMTLRIYVFATNTFLRGYYFQVLKKKILLKWKR